MAKSLISMLEIADVVCEDAGDVAKRFRTSILRHISNCYRDLQIFVNNDSDIVTVSFPLSNVIEMPPDFIYETKVGIKYGDKIALISKDYDKGSNSKLTVNQTGIRHYLDSIFFKDSYHECITPMYNYKGDLILAYGPGLICDGMYTVDKKNGRIELGSEVPAGCEIIVEYVSDGVSVGQKMVPIEMYNCLYHYGLWKFFFQRKDNRFAQSAQDYDSAYYQLEMLYKFVPINYIVSLFNQETHTINDRL